MTDFLQTFGLTYEQMRILFSLEFYLVYNDSRHDHGIDFGAGMPFRLNSELKRYWIEAYFHYITALMKEIDPSSEKDGLIIYDLKTLKELITTEEKKSNTYAWKYIILLEWIAFNPYFPLNEEKNDRKSYERMSVDDKIKKEGISTIAVLLGLESSDILKLEESYNFAIGKLAGLHNRLFNEFGPRIIDGMQYMANCFNAYDLSKKAESLRSRLKAYGSGVISTVESVKSGGMALMIGGLILDSDSNSTVFVQTASANPILIMNECAKIYVIVKEIVKDKHLRVDISQDIFYKIIDREMLIKKALMNLRNQSGKNQEQMKNLENSMEYLEKLYNQIQLLL